MDMNAGYAGFAAVLVDLPVWVMNVVPIDVPDTLNIVMDRWLIGMYHDWCESFSTYPRTYDILHSSFLFKYLGQRCDILDVVVEIDRILRPNGYLLVQDSMEILNAHFKFAFTSLVCNIASRSVSCGWVGFLATYKFFRLNLH